MTGARLMIRRLYEARNLFGLGLGLVLFLVALWTLHHELATLHLAHVLTRLRAVPFDSVGFALLFMAASYLALAGYDALALQTIGRRLPFARVAMTAFTATAVGHNLGVAMISGGAVRLRMYSAMGLSAAEVAAVVAWVGFTFGIGVTCVLALVLVIAPAEAALLLHIPEGVARIIGIGVMGLLGTYLIWGKIRRLPVRIGAWQIQVPGVATSLAQIGLATADLVCAAAVLFVLLPEDLSVS